MRRGDTIQIREAEGDPLAVTTRTVYHVEDACWWDTTGQRWPLDNDQYRYTTTPKGS